MPIDIRNTQVDTTLGALRVSQRPPEALGSYRIASVSGLTTGLAANGVIFSLRWGDATRLCLIRRIKIIASVITGFTAAQEIAYDATVGRAWTTNYTGGTAINLATNNGKKRTTMGASLFGTNGDIRIATTAALATGAPTLDAQPFMVNTGKTLATVATVQDQRLENDMEFFDSYPLVLAQNEGFVIRNSVALGVAGTIRWGVEVDWLEVNSY